MPCASAACWASRPPRRWTTRAGWTGRSASGSAAATANACPMYAWTNRLARGEEMGALEIELYRRGATDPELTRRFLDVMARTRAPADAFGPATKASLALAAARGPGGVRTVAREIGQELRDVIAEQVQRGRLRFATRWRGRSRSLPSKARAAAARRNGSSSSRWRSACSASALKSNAASRGSLRSASVRNSRRLPSMPSESPSISTIWLSGE